MLTSLPALAHLVRPLAFTSGAFLGALCLCGAAHAGASPKASLKKPEVSVPAVQLQLPPVQLAPEPTPSTAASEPLPAKSLSAVDCLMDRVPSVLEVSADAQTSEVHFTPLAVAVTCLMAVSSDAPWIQANVQRASGRLTLVIDPNPESAPRTAYAYVATKTGSFAIRVQQLGRLGTSDTPPAPAVLPAEPAVAAPSVNALPALLPK